MKWQRAAFLIFCGCLLLLGLYSEHHTINRLDRAAPGDFNGLSFIQGATVDKFLLKDGLLFAVDSLSPEGNQAKDCKT
jgi:hypothetical protein